jgi:threonine dehydrogenase-like Zn-dependent dehydrogenase
VTTASVPDTTLVARWYSGEDLRLEQAAVREPGPGELLVRMLASGVSSSNVHAAEGDFGLWPTPLTLGHEGAGIVEQAGVGVAGADQELRVAIAPSSSCGRCFNCREATELLCADRAVIAGTGSEYSTVPAAMDHPVPEGVGWRKAVLAEPLSCAVHAVGLATVRPGDWVAVVGGGTMGLLALLVAKASGARVLVSELTAERRAAALDLGADAAVEPDGLGTLSLELTEGIGVDYAIEAVGSTATVAHAIALPRRGGTVVLMGVAPQSAEVAVRPYDLYTRELTIHGSFIRRFEFQRAVRLLAQLLVEELVTDVFPPADICLALDHVAARRGLQTVVAPDPEALP